MKFKKAIFLHIPRTGGTSLREQLRSEYGARFIYDKTFRLARVNGINLIRLKKLNGVYPENYMNKKFIMGHFYHEKYDHMELPFITILRNPLNRMKSQYVNSKTKLSFEEFTKKNRNIMTRMTGGDLDKFAFVGILEEFEETVKRLQDFLHIKLDSLHINANKAKRPKSFKGFDELNKDDINLYKKALERFWR